MKLFDRVAFHAFGALAAVFAWWFLQLPNDIGWLAAAAAGSMLVGTIRKGVIDEVRTHGRD